MRRKIVVAALVLVALLLIVVVGLVVDFAVNWTSVRKQEDAFREIIDSYNENKEFFAQFVNVLSGMSAEIGYSCTDSGWRAVVYNENYREVDLSEFGIADQVNYLINELQYKEM